MYRLGRSSNYYRVPSGVSISNSKRNGLRIKREKNRPKNEYKRTFYYAK